MNGAALQTAQRLAELDLPDLARRLASDGLWLDLGAVTIRTQSDSPAFARQLRVAYGEFPLQEGANWADLHVRLCRPAGFRRWLRPQVEFFCDGHRPFDPFPAERPLPLYEWGCNFLIGRRLNDAVLFHAGALERDGLALLLPALPGSGKSTLTAALAQRGWRLLSDEFGAYDPDSGTFRAVLKPIALKNQSIEIIRAYAPESVIGTSFEKTRKGTIAHLAPGREAVDRRQERARPGAIVLPKWERGSRTRFEPVAEHVTFPALAFNAFNYALLGAVGFQSAVELVRACPAWQLIYSDLDEALATLDSAWVRVLDHHARNDS